MTRDEIIKNRANLYRAKLRGADLSGADLSGANLYEADLRGADLYEANLSEANLSEANLRGADLYEANLSEANLYRAKLRGADLSGADLYEANLSEADLSGANLYRADLYGADLSGANLYGADLYEANLSEAKNIPPQFKSNLNILKWQKNKLFAFKYLKGDTSPYQNFKYELEKEYYCENGNNDDRILCGEGINLASLEWCLQETHCDLTKTYSIFEFDPVDILSIPYNSDGKFRVRRARYIRNLTEEELKNEIEPLYKGENNETLL